MCYIMYGDEETKLYVVSQCAKYEEYCYGESMYLYVVFEEEKIVTIIIFGFADCSVTSNMGIRLDFIFLLKQI